MDDSAPTVAARYKSYLISHLEPDGALKLAVTQLKKSEAIRTGIGQRLLPCQPTIRPHPRQERELGIGA